MITQPSRLARAPAWLMTVLAVTLAGAAGGGCVGVPRGVRPVENFDAQRYAGTWYEVARLPNRFEDGLDRISAEYRPRTDGGFDVVNRGYDPAKDAWDEARGKAYFVAGPTTGQLKVSFFGPFYGSYNVIALDDVDYRWSLVCGNDRSYLWILARTPQLEQPIIDRLTAQARSAGFDTDRLIFVKH